MAINPLPQAPQPVDFLGRTMQALGQADASHAEAMRNRIAAQYQQSQLPYAGEDIQSQINQRNQMVELQKQQLALKQLLMQKQIAGLEHLIHPGMQNTPGSSQFGPQATFAQDMPQGNEQMPEYKPGQPLPLSAQQTDKLKTMFGNVGQNVSQPVATGQMENMNQPSAQLTPLQKALQSRGMAREQMIGAAMAGIPGAGERLFDVAQKGTPEVKQEMDRNNDMQIKYNEGAAAASEILSKIEQYKQALANTPKWKLDPGSRNLASLVDDPDIRALKNLNQDLMIEKAKIMGLPVRSYTNQEMSALTKASADPMQRIESLAPNLHILEASAQKALANKQSMDEWMQKHKTLQNGWLPSATLPFSPEKFHEDTLRDPEYGKAVWRTLTPEQKNAWNFYNMKLKMAGKK